MKNEIVKLMIATMAVDGDLAESEFKVIKGAISILGVDIALYEELITEVKELDGISEIQAWCKPELENLKALQDPAISSVAIANMVLVAYADGKIKKVENSLIQSSAFILKVSGPTLN
jgi:uncharacterized tellurite resistance protein B-like protein